MITRSERGSRVLLVLLIVMQSVGTVVLFPLFAFTQQSGTGLRLFAVTLALFALGTVRGVWHARAWAPWAALVLLACKLTLDLFNWSLNLDRALLPLSTLINAGILVLVFHRPFAPSDRVTRAQKIFFGWVLALAACIGVWGMFVPALADYALPFKVPPLHARFLGAMYLSGATFMALGMRARAWPEVRVVVPMIAIWTGMLGIVSLFHLPAFDWGRKQVWTWFIAYTAFPIIAAWIAWVQRSRREHRDGVPLSPLLRRYLLAQGAIVTPLALWLLLAPGFMTTLWPWAITPALAQIYSAPFLSYGLGSLLAARQHSWAEVRIVVVATLLFTSGVLIASALHAGLFSLRSPATWIWFGGFGLAWLCLLLFCVVPALRTQPSRRRGGHVPASNSYG